MLARTPRTLCIECGLAYDAPGFVFYHDDPLQGPAYWSDQGLLCSPACALDHARQRMADGTLTSRPVDCPVDVVGV